MTAHKGKPQRLVKLKSKAQYNALHRLNSFINGNDKRLVRFLIRTWNDQQAAITYKELREAILVGTMTEETFKAWQSDYVGFFNKYLKDTLINATTAGGKEIAAALLAGKDVYTPMLTGIDNWITVHGAEWITQMSNEAKEAVSTMIQYSAKGNMTVDELARIIRPTIGLTEPQSIANATFYENTKERIKKQLMEKNPTMKETTAEKQAAKRAQESALRYAARQHRERAQMIAETELAYAYNKGTDDAIHQAVDEGLLPRMKAQWSTAADEGVCGICAALDGVEVDLGDSFEYKGRTLYQGQKQTPPAHPRCRCALCYVEAND
ncbi:MAG: phage head morphogenesis protein [Clostridia bacterium]|nr:phage head morphogenesis protein [Clostridia bacterium]